MDVLVERFRSGDKTAFEMLVEPEVHGLRAFVALRAPAAHMIDEIAHESIVFAWERREIFTGGSIGAWLRAIAAQLLRKEIQRFAREHVQRDKYKDTLLRTMDKAVIHDHWEIDFLELCMAGLGERMRHLVRLRYDESWSSVEISEKTHQSVSWVNTTLYRLRKKLKNCMEQHLEKAQ